MIYDFCVIGGGIVGLATAKALQEAKPNASILLLEKEPRLASHQTSHNSGVIHAGIYYAPGSLKAKLCKEGNKETKAFCSEHSIPFETCGKLIVATNKVEEKRVKELFDRSLIHGLPVRMVDKDEMNALEPNVSGTLALLSPETGIVDYAQVARRMADVLSSRGAELYCSETVQEIRESSDRVTIHATTKTIQARNLIVCGGLQADRLAKIAGMQVDFQIVPFRGEYFQLPRSLNGIVKHLIYPAPDPDLPFLGVHLTRMIDGSITVGPNAVLGMAREGYPKGAFNLKDTARFMTFPGFWRFIWDNRKHAVDELRSSFSKRYYLELCRKYCPSLQFEDLMPYRAGIRAQVILNNGKPAHDFLFGETPRMLHVYNAPSPAATSAIPIGRMIAQKCLDKGPH